MPERTDADRVSLVRGMVYLYYRLLTLEISKGLGYLVFGIGGWGKEDGYDITWGLI